MEAFWLGVRSAFGRSSIQARCRPSGERAVSLYCCTRKNRSRVSFGVALRRTGDTHAIAAKMRRGFIDEESGCLPKNLNPIGGGVRWPRSPPPAGVFQDRMDGQDIHYKSIMN